MLSPKSDDSADPALALDLVLPTFDTPMADHWPSKMTWTEAMDAFAPARAEYMRKFDSRERRLRDKNPEPFRLPP